METRRGLIVERSGRKVTALGRSGELVTFRPAGDDLMVGMEVDLPAKRPAFAWRLAPALALSLILVVVSAFGYQQYLYAQPTVAYLTVDSTGSVELEINQAGLVKSATAIDEAGQQALSSIEFKNKPAEEVVAALVKVQDPEETAEVVVAVVPVPVPSPSGERDRHSTKAEKAVEKMERKVVDEAGHSSAKVTSLRLDPEVRESAKQLGISAGRAALWALSHRNETPSDPPVVEDPGPEDPGTSVETPGQEEPDPGSNPPGQGKKDDILGEIKGALPKVSEEDLTDLNKHQDSKDREKFLKDLTKDWIDRVKEQLEENEEEDDKPGKGNDGKGKEGKDTEGKGSEGQPPSEQPPDDKTPGGKGQNDGHDDDNDDEHEDEDEGKGGKGTGAAPTESTGAPPSAIASSDDHNSPGGWTSKRSGLPKALDDLFRRLPWLRKK